MYDRAPRILVATAPSNSTPPSIGPGVYGPETKESRNGYAPFLSMSKRESFLTISDQVAIAPGPGQYSPADKTVDKIKGGSTLQNKATRFSPPPSFTPGPGAYSVGSTFSKKQEQLATIKGRDHQAFGRVVYSRQRTAPSIPYPGQSYGYEENDYGQLMPKDLPEKDSTMGPTYYNVTYDETLATKKYKGVHFGQLKSQRTQFKGRQGPGPGDYNPRPSQKGTAIAIQRSAAMLPRYHELVPQMEEKKGVPGPGKYNLPSQFHNQDALVEPPSNPPPPFGCSQARFVSSFPDSPASTKYDDPRTAFESLKRISGLTRSPFGQTSARFRTDRKALEIPGPGAYNDEAATGMSNKLLKRAIVPGMKQSAFGTSSVRTIPLTKRDEENMPGPGMYQEASQPTSKSEKVSAVFSSTTKRLYSPPPIVTSIPPPGSYEVSESYSKIQGRVETKKPTLNSAFMSSNSRFAPPRDVMLNETDFLNPGPGEYDPDLRTRVGNDQRGLLCSKEERFKLVLKSDLGPGSYQMCKSRNDTLLKGTFNTTLNNPLTIEEEQSPREQQTSSAKGQTIVLNS